MCRTLPVGEGAHGETDRHASNDNSAQPPLEPKQEVSSNLCFSIWGCNAMRRTETVQVGIADSESFLHPRVMSFSVKVRKVSMEGRVDRSSSVVSPQQSANFVLPKRLLERIAWISVITDDQGIYNGSKCASLVDLKSSPGQPRGPSSNTFVPS